MRVLILLLVCLKYGDYSARGQQRTDVFGQVLLQLYFDPFYNSFEKACCKSYSNGCRVFLNNRGYVDNTYKGRISLREFNGGMEVRIWSLQRGDAGYYRCTILGTSVTLIYKDTYVEILDSVARLSPLPPFSQPSNHLTTVTTFPVSAGVTSEETSDIKENPRFTWKVILLVAAGFSLVLMIVISVVVMAVHHHRKRAKGKDTYSGKPDDSTDSMLSHTSEEVAPIIYTVVDFKPREETSELYENACMYSPRTTRAKTPLEPLDTVEYSTVARSL